MEKLTEKEIYDLKKSEQVIILKEYGLTREAIKELRYEKQRVENILQLQQGKEDFIEGVVEKVLDKVVPNVAILCRKCGTEMIWVSGSASIDNYKCPECRANQSINKWR